LIALSTLKRASLKFHFILQKFSSVGQGDMKMLLPAFTMSLALLAQIPRPNRAAQRFDEGRAAMKAGRFQEACAAFAESHRAEPALGALLNLADCLEKQRQFASAFTRFNEAESWAKRTKESARESFAKERAKALKNRLSWLALSASESCAAKVDGVELQLTENAVSVPLDIGTHVVQVVQPGFETLTREVVLQHEDETISLRLALQKISAGLAPISIQGNPSLNDSAQLGNSQPGDLEKPSPSAAPATALVVGGGLLAIAGAGGLIWSYASVDKFKTQPVVSESEFNTVRWIYPASIVAAAVGGAAVGTGVLLLIFNRPVATSTTSITHHHMLLVPELNPHGIGVSLTGHF
jgi:PEGA domain